MKESLLMILRYIKCHIGRLPSRTLSGDIVDRGVILTGGGFLLKGMEEWLTTEIYVPVALAPNPLESVAIGTGKALKYVHRLPSAAK